MIIYVFALFSHFSEKDAQSMIDKIKAYLKD